MGEVSTNVKEVHLPLPKALCPTPCMDLQFIHAAGPTRAFSAGHQIQLDLGGAMLWSVLRCNQGALEQPRGTSLKGSQGEAVPDAEGVHALGIPQPILLQPPLDELHGEATGVHWCLGIQRRQYLRSQLPKHELPA